MLVTKPCIRSVFEIIIVVVAVDGGATLKAQ